MIIKINNLAEDCGGSSAASLGAIPTGGSRVNKTTEANSKEYNVYVGQYELLITDKVLDKPYELIDTLPLYDNLEDDLLVDYPSATIVYDQDIKNEVIDAICPWMSDDPDSTGIQFADFSDSAVKV